MNVIDLYKAVWLDLQSRRTRLPHALLLTGQRGLGKSALARAFAAGLLCERPLANGAACGKCLACNWMGQGNHPDFRLLQPPALAAEMEANETRKGGGQQITIDQVRALDEFLNVGTHRAGLRIIVVNPAEAMNRSTANALLKSLEEPAASTLFLLVSGEPLRLLPTIRSRCQLVAVNVPAREISIPSLAAEGLADAGRWLALAGGSPGLAIELAASGQGGWLELLTGRLAEKREMDPIGLAGDIDKAIRDSKGKLTLKSVVEAMQKWHFDLTLASSGLPVRYFLPEQTTICGLAAMIPPARLIRAYRALATRRREVEQPLNTRLFLEGLFLDYRGLLGT